MAERWAVAYEPFGSEQGRFIWVLNQCGDIMVFGSQWEAKKWILTSASLDCSEDEVVLSRFLLMPRPHVSEEKSLTPLVFSWTNPINIPVCIGRWVAIIINYQE